MPSAELRSRFVNANGIRTHYSESGGNGPVVIGLHGGGAGSSGAAGMGPLMRHLPEGIRFIALDSIGGFGKTDPGVPSPQGLQSRVDHLEDFVEALCLDKFTILGNSQGAWCAARYALLHPERIEKIILIGSATIAGAMGITEPPTEGMKALFGYDGSLDGMRKLLEALVYDKSKITDDLLKLRHAAAARPGAMDAFRAGTKANQLLQSDPLLRFQFAMHESLPALTRSFPTLVIWGESDGFATPNLGKQVQPLLPAAEWRWIAKAGHQVQTDQPEQTASIIEEFLRG